MQQVIEYVVVPITAKYSFARVAAVRVGRLVRRDSRIAAYAVKNRSAKAIQERRRALDRRLRFDRLFEGISVCQVDSDRTRASLTEGLFSWLHRRYARLITRDRNVLCYEYLFGAAMQLMYLSRPPLILDVGAGPGTIALSQVPRRAHGVFCFDSSTRMRQLARDAGLRVLSPLQFGSGPPLDVDLALSVYVMHFCAGHAQLLAAVTRHLRINGVWAMNFHKGSGLDSFLRHLGHQTGLQLVERHQSDTFGAVLLLRRLP